MVGRREVRFSLQVAVVTLLALLLVGMLGWRSGDFVAVWLSPDQRGWFAYQHKDFPAAAAHFADPRWIGTAAAAAGRYPEAAAAFGRVGDAVGFYNRGVALLKGREYAQAIASFELAVAQAPEWTEARQNLELSRHILDYLEQTREQSGTDGKLGADEIRYDADSERGQRVVVDDDSEIRTQTAEKWMRSVDTETSEFLTLRFALEQSRGEGL